MVWPLDQFCQTPFCSIFRPSCSAVTDGAVCLKSNTCRDGSDMAKSIQKSGVLLQPMSRTTLSGTLFEKLVGHVVKGDWKEGERIPSEREISGQL